MAPFPHSNSRERRERATATTVLATVVATGLRRSICLRGSLRRRPSRSRPRLSMRKMGRVQRQSRVFDGRSRTTATERWSLKKRPWTLRGEMKKQEELFVSLLNNSTECSLTTSFSKCDTSWRAALDEEMYANFQSGQYYTQFNTTSQ